MKSPKPRNKAQRKVDYKNYGTITMRRNYDTKLTATHNYEEKLSQEIMRRNYGSSAVGGNMFLESNASLIPGTYVGSSIPGTYLGSSTPCT